VLEKNVYLQQEIENKMELIISIQRIKDELKDANIELAVLRSKLNDTNTNTAVETITSYPTPSPKKSSTVFSTIYNYPDTQGINNTMNQNMNISHISTPIMDDGPNDHLLSNEILQKNASNDLNEGLLLFSPDGSPTAALNKKPLYMVQEFLERAKSLEMKMSNARNTLAQTNELSS